MHLILGFNKFLVMTMPKARKEGVMSATQAAHIPPRDPGQYPRQARATCSTEYV